MNKRILGLAAVLAAVAAVATGSASAANVDCGQAGGIVTGTAAGSVYVGPATSCIVVAAHVTGSVQVQQGGSLLLIGSRVDRNIQSAGAAWLVIAGANTVLGNVQITGTTALPPAMTANQLCTTTVTGSLMLAGNTAPFRVGCGPGLGNSFGSAMVVGNSGAVTFQNNTVTGTAICTGAPAVTGSANTATKKIGCP